MDSKNQTICYSMDDQFKEEEACILALQLASGTVLPMVLKAAIELELFELMKKAAGSSASASELAAQLPTKNPDAANMIDRMLRLLAANSVLNCSLKRLSHGGVDRCYSLAAVGKFFTRNEDGVSVAPMSLLSQDKVFVEPWYHLKDAVLEGGVPFVRAHAMDPFQYFTTNPRINKIFDQAMFGQSTIFMKKILEKYKGFEGLKSLVDVAGGIGASLNMIISKYPSIEGINFDLPHVVRNASSHPGVEHVGGDMFVSVPKAEAIFMKWICHNWSDAQCEKLLKNCYEALPENGKVIVAEAVLPEDPDSGLSLREAALVDMVMLSITPGGRERSEKEFHALAKNAGFRQFFKVCSANNIWIMELHK